MNGEQVCMHCMMKNIFNRFASYLNLLPICNLSDEEKRKAGSVLENILCSKKLLQEEQFSFSSKGGLLLATVSTVPQKTS